MELTLEGESICPSMVSDVLNDYVGRDLEKLQTCHGKTILARSSEGDYFTVRSVYEGEDDAKLMEALRTIFIHHEVSQFVIAFDGYVGEPPPDGTYCFLLIEGNSDCPNPVIRQVCANWDDGKITGFSEMLVDGLDEDFPLNLLNPTTMPVKEAKEFLKERKKDKEKLIIMGPDLMEGTVVYNS